MSSPNETFSPTDALKLGWTVTVANLVPLLLIGAVGTGLAIVNSALGQSALAGLVRVLVQAAEVAVLLAYTRAALSLHDGHTLEPPLLRSPLPQYFNFLLASVLYGVIVAVGFVLLIVPGVIWGLQFAFTGFLVVDRHLDPVQALRESSRLTHGLKGQLLIFALLAFGVNLLGTLAFGIGLLFTVPMTFIASVHVLRALQARAGAVTPTPTAPIPAAG
jgi:uncharacterized membrane protein